MLLGVLLLVLHDLAQVDERVLLVQGGPMQDARVPVVNDAHGFNHAAIVSGQLQAGVYCRSVSRRHATSTRAATSHVPSGIRVMNATLTLAQAKGNVSAEAAAERNLRAVLGEVGDKADWPKFEMSAEFSARYMPQEWLQAALNQVG